MIDTTSPLAVDPLAGLINTIFGIAKLLVGEPFMLEAEGRLEVVQAKVCALEVVQAELYTSKVMEAEAHVPEVVQA